MASLALFGGAGGVRRCLTQETVIAMQTGWTRPNDEIARFLERHDRHAIPFNLVFGPATASSIAFPEVLIQENVIDALNTAAARNVACD